MRTQCYVSKFQQSTGEARPGRLRLARANWRADHVSLTVSLKLWLALAILKCLPGMEGPETLR